MNPSSLPDSPPIAASSFKTDLRVPRRIDSIDPSASGVAAAARQTSNEGWVFVGKAADLLRTQDIASSRRRPGA
jgi:hypothetical protein